MGGTSSRGRRHITTQCLAPTLVCETAFSNTFYMYIGLTENKDFTLKQNDFTLKLVYYVEN